MQLHSDQVGTFRKTLGEVWVELTALLDELSIHNFSLWGVEDLVFCYCEASKAAAPPAAPPPGEKSPQARLASICSRFDTCGRWLARPGRNMRLMYEDFGVVRQSKELIRHRVFVTRLKPGMQEEYKRRHSALEAARGGRVNPGPDSNFSIWNVEDLIFGYDEIDVTMETIGTAKARQAAVPWETGMLEIMDWITDDVDWLTGLRHDHIERLAHHN